MQREALDVIRDVFNGRADRYDESVWHRELALVVADFVDLGDVQHVLDVATGTGLVLRALDERAPGLDLYGVDISAGMLGVAAAILPRGTWFEAEAARVPLPDASVDAITCVTALHLIPETAASVAEWRRMLRPGGRAVTATFLRGSRQPGPAKYRQFPVDHAPFDTVETLSATFAPWGFTVTRHSQWVHGDHAMLIAELAPTT